MVRLETVIVKLEQLGDIVFTFQYGQIRNQIAGHENMMNNINLHSSMVRLETIYSRLYRYSKKKFTFQYGQIRNP